MTQISYIHGLPEKEIKDRSKAVPKKSFIDYKGISEGELRLQLINEQINILAAFYPEEKAWTEGQKQLGDYLSGGVHGRNIPSSNLLPFLQRQIKAATNLSKKPAISGNDFIPVTNCDQFININEDYYGNVTQQYTSEYYKCVKENEYKNLLNEYLEESSHHLLYNYVVNANNEPQVVASKSLQHKLAIGKLSEITGLSKSNLQLWIRNGIMRTNAKQGTQPFQPEQTIATMAAGLPQYNRDQQGINLIDPATLLAVAKIISAIVAALIATKALIDNMKMTDQQKLQAATNYYGQKEFGPESGDYPPDWDLDTNTTINTSSIDMLPILLIGGGLLLTSK